jgi:hypothetical protein
MEGWEVGECGGLVGWGRTASAHDGEDVLLGEEDVLVGAELDVGAGILAVEHLVAHAHFGSLAGAVVIALAGTHLDDLTDLGLFLGGVGKKDAAGGLLLGFGHLDEDAISEGLDRGDAERNSSHG